MQLLYDDVDKLWHEQTFVTNGYILGISCIRQLFSVFSGIISGCVFVIMYFIYDFHIF